MVNQFEGDSKEQLIWAACLILPQFLAVTSTVARLVYRKRNQGLWWDDHMALISLALALMVFATPWLALVRVQDPTPHIVGGWLFTFSYPVLIWTSRVSLALCIARIMPRQHPIFLSVLCICFFFGAICLALVTQLIVASARDTSWTQAPPYIYVPGHRIAIFILCGDLIGDALLITIPLRLFWNAKLPPVELFLIKTGFAASVLTSICSIICASFVLAHNIAGQSQMIVEIGLTHILICLSLMVCNALVIITSLYRYFRRQVEQPSFDLVETSPSSDQYLFTEPTMSSPLPTSFALTDVSDMMGYRHTFSSP